MRRPLAAKAFDRFHPLYAAHTDASGTVGPAPGDKEPWLNAVETAGLIVQAFAQEVVERFGADLDNNGKPDAAEGDSGAFMRWLEPECDALNNLFLGGPLPPERDYKRGPWNHPDHLGSSIINNLGLPESEPRKAVRDAFMYLADQLTDIVLANTDQPVEEWGWQLTASCERLRNALLGIPADLGE